MVVRRVIDRPLAACERDQDVTRRAPHPRRIWVGVSEDEIDFILCLEPCRIRTLAIRHRLSRFRRCPGTTREPVYLAPRWLDPRARLSLERPEPCEVFASRGRIPCSRLQLSYDVASRFPR